MAGVKWCLKYNLWCSDVSDLIEYLECDLDCKYCDMMEKVMYGG